MLNKSKSFSSFSVSDLSAAKQFYTDKLGLDVKEDSMGFIEIELTGSHNVIAYPKDDHSPATFTVLNFIVDDIEEAVEELKTRGVVFESYTGTIETDKNNISRAEQGPQIAWFKDPSGNIFSVLEN